MLKLIAGMVTVLALALTPGSSSAVCAMCFDGSNCGAVLGSGWSGCWVSCCPAQCRNISPACTDPGGGGSGCGVTGPSGGEGPDLIMPCDGSLIGALFEAVSPAASEELPAATFRTTSVGVVDDASALAAALRSAFPESGSDIRLVSSFAGLTSRGRMSARLEVDGARNVELRLTMTPRGVEVAGGMRGSAPWALGQTRLVLENERVIAVKALGSSAGRRLYVALAGRVGSGSERDRHEMVAANRSFVERSEAFPARSSLTARLVPMDGPEGR